MNENKIISETQFIKFSDNYFLDLQFGGRLSNIKVAYQTYGQLNSKEDNVILICHALTGNSHAAGIQMHIEKTDEDKPDYLKIYSEMNLNKEGWWSGIVGKNLGLDTDKFFIICSNIIGSCYGSLGPTSINPLTHKVYKTSFPLVSVRDMVTVQMKLLNLLGIKKVKLAIGGSLGGMQVLEWMVSYPEFIENAICIAAPAEHTPWAIALNESARQAIFNDPNWNNGDYEDFKVKGLEIARMIGMISYRSSISFDKKFGRKQRIDENGRKIFEVESYLRYQGKKLNKRFDPWSYIILTYAMDNHNIALERGDDAYKVLKNIKLKGKILYIGISSDVLYPPYLMKKMNEFTNNSFYVEIISDLGHDAFLIEFDQLNQILKSFLE
jgi:homoserine O-acetyltransferase